MPVTPSEIATQMIEALAVTEPDMDTSIGTPVRKILDAVAEVVAEGYVDRHLLDYQYDIESKSGADLDDFVRLFGFTRLGAKRATGSVTFSRTASPTTIVLIPSGTQVATTDALAVVVATVVPAVIGEGETETTVPVQAVVGGVDGNVSANSLTRVLTPVSGVSSYTNPVSLTGGTEQESDEQLRLRFKRTVFRNLAGTEQMFAGVALEDDDVSQVNVIGATKRRREQLELVSGEAIATIEDAKLVYPDSSYFGPSLDEGNVLSESVHYQFVASNPPQVISLDPTEVPDGVYELDFEYVPVSSRNDPDAGITNRVDVYVNGERAQEAVETIIFRTSRTFSATEGDPLWVGKFQRTSEDPPEAGNYFLDFAFTPVISVGETINIGGNVYTKDVDFFLVNDITAEGGTIESYSGIELVSAANGATVDMPTDQQAFVIDYTFNAVPRDVEYAIAQWRLVTTDVRVHQARKLRLNLHFAVIYTSGYTEDAVKPSLEEALEAYISRVGFSGFVQASDLLEVAHGVPGVDAVRFLTNDDDPTNYAIQRVNEEGDVVETFANNIAGQPRRAIDVVVRDDEVPVFNEVFLTIKAPNTFGSV